MRYCFGVDIGGTTVKMGLFEAAGEILDKWEIKTRTENNGSAILPDVAEAILKKVEEHKLNKEDIVGVGVGVVTWQVIKWAIAGLAAPSTAGTSLVIAGSLP